MNQQPPPPRSTQPPTRKPGDRPPPPIVAYEDVKASCGHIEKFGLFADHLDRWFRNDRRRKVTNRPCKVCREAKYRQEQEAEPQQPRRQVASAKHERLPDGAKFEAVYNAQLAQWAGSLTVEGETFTARAPALDTLTDKLDRRYQQRLREKSARKPRGG